MCVQNTHVAYIRPEYRHRIAPYIQSTDTLMKVNNFFVPKNPIKYYLIMESDLKQRKDCDVSMLYSHGRRHFVRARLFFPHTSRAHVYRRLVWQNGEIHKKMPP